MGVNRISSERTGGTSVKIVTLVMILVLEAVASAQPTAEDLYSQGEDAFNRRDYPTAIDRWQTSYALSQEPLLLFNLAHAYRLSGDCPRALETYKRFMAEAPSSEEYTLAASLAHELEAKCSRPSALVVESRANPVAAVENERPSVRTEPAGRKLRIGGAVIGGAGLLTLATGLYLGHRGQTIGDEVMDACRVSCDWADWKDKDAKGQRYASIGRVLDVGGAIGIASGVALYYLGVRQGSLTVEPRTREGGAAVSFRGSW